MEKPSLPKGTRDFGPAQMAKRQFIVNNIRFVFQKYGFMPLETPAMENLSTLTGKYGDEGDQLLFKVLDSGDFSETIRESIDQARKVEARWKFEFNSTFLETFNHLRGIKSELMEFDEEGFPTRSYGADNSPDNFIEQVFLKHKSEIQTTLKSELKFNHFIHAYNTSTNLFNSIFSIYQAGVYKILNHKELARDITKKGMRYDLTVPFARYVVMNRGEITLPFKRYQIQPVWRADRPQKGRYREFFQCDADVVGTDSLVNEAEIVLMIKEVFGLLQIKDFTIKINHRGILSGLAELSKENSGPVTIEPGTGELKIEGHAPTVTVTDNSLFVAIDKLDKIGEDKVAEELRTKGFTDGNIKQVFETLKTTGTNAEKIQKLSARFANSESSKKGLADLTEVFSLLQHFGSSEANVEFDISLARGLSYYTGPIFEVKVNNVSIGSVSGGGRYDNLTQAFGSKERLSGVGISFGIDRMYDVMEELNLFPKEAIQFTKVLIVHMEEESMKYGMRVAQSLRFNNIPTEIYPEISKVKKQLDYANKKQIPFAVIIGQDEMVAGKVGLKNLISGDQESLDLHALIEKLK